MKASLIALVACCAVTGTAFALQEDPGTHPPQVRLTEDPGTHPPQVRLTEDPGTHPPQMRLTGGAAASRFGIQ